LYFKILLILYFLRRFFFLARKEKNKNVLAGLPPQMLFLQHIAAKFGRLLHHVQLGRFKKKCRQIARIRAFRGHLGGPSQQPDLGMAGKMPQVQQGKGETKFCRFEKLFLPQDYGLHACGGDV
jgi:hypothetical protein